MYESIGLLPIAICLTVNTYFEVSLMNKEAINILVTMSYSKYLVIEMYCVHHFKNSATTTKHIFI